MIIARTPFRVSFVGGGSDLPAFCDRQPGAVLSTTIDKAVYLTLHPYFDREKTFLRYSKSELITELDAIEHPLFREALRFTRVTGGVEISSTADVPSGTGLGSSSAFAVGLIHVLTAYQGHHASREILASAASHLEIDVLGEPIGRQDHYAAAYGGVNVIEFFENGRVRVEPVTVARKVLSDLEQRLLMFYTGTQRATRTVLLDQTRHVANDEGKFKATAEMVKLVYRMRDALFAEDLPVFGELLQQNWELKRSLSTHISNQAIDAAYLRAMEAGAGGGKLLGAGAGGFLLLYCEPEYQTPVRKALSDLPELPFRFDFSGSRIIYTDGFDIGESRRVFSQ